MSQRLLQLDDVRNTDTPDKVASLFQKLGYNATRSAQPLAVKDLELPDRSADVIEDSYLIADHQKGATNSLQVLLFQLKLQEWETPSTASNRMRAIAQSLCRRPSKFLLIGTQNYRQLMLVNPRTSLDAQMNVKTSIRKLLIDRTNPTAYDRDRLEAIAARDLDPLTLYNRQCEAFDVEKLTKEFYKGYKEIFEQVQRVIRETNPHPYFDDASRLHQFSQRLLGRVMFLYFLQKKEFLGGDRDFLKNQYLKLKPEPEDTEFYTTLLEPLFFEMLNKERPNFESPWGKIPYLNGGLFDRDYGDDVIDAAGFQTPDQLILPNSLFDPSGERGVLKFFNGYNFTVSENVQGDEDVAVDPEMLGKVFENMLAADERGQSGTFYTPRGIVHFMCVESLSRYLADESGVDLEVVKQLAEYEAEMPDAELRRLLSTDQTRKLKQALETVKVCDPAVGSGAFPLGMMQVILSVWQAIRQREGESLKRGSLAMSRLKRKIIANNLYGVDIKPEAIEIAKLRMWLSMVVDIPTIDDVEPLPNLDYKLMAGNSLISTIAGEHLIPDPTTTQQGMLNVTPIQAAIQPLLDLQHQYFESHANERKDLSKQIREAEATVFRAAIVDRRQYWQGEQRKLEQDIKRMGKASKAQTQKLQTFDAKLKELNTIEIDVGRGLRSLDFFQWHLHFNDVFQQKGGFDVVIGNPPYINLQKIKDESLISYYKNEFTSYQGKADLLYLFIEKASSLLKQDGYLQFITASYFLKSHYANKLRKFILSECQINQVVDFGDIKVFESANVDTCIVNFKRKRNITDLSFKYGLLLDKEELHNFLTRFSRKLESNKHYSISKNEQSELNEQSWNLQTRQTPNDSLKLGEICNIGKGAATGKDVVFVVDKSLAKRINLEAEILEDLVEDCSIDQYKFRTSAQVLIRTRRGTDISEYPYVKDYLIQHKEALEQRYAVQREGVKWFEIVRFNEEIFSNEVDEQIYCYYRSPYNKFAYSNKKLVTLTTTFVLTKKQGCELDMKFLLGVLNSRFMQKYSVDNAKKMGQCFEYSSSFLASIPINLPEESQHSAVVGLVEKILEAISKESFHTDLDEQEKVRRIRSELDQVVYKIYSLTSEEIEAIEGVIQE